MTKEYIFSDLEKIAVEKNLISDEFENDKWQVVDYETGKVSGKMLTTPEVAFPKNLTLDINLTGVYNIYICIPKFRMENTLYIKLSDDLCFTGLKAAREKERPQSWGIEEYMEEIYWKTADLTGKSIVIGKRDSVEASLTSLAWIRCVSADANDIEKFQKNKCLQCHIDQDQISCFDLENAEDYLDKLYAFKNSNTEFVSFEFAADIDTVSEGKYPRRTKMDEKRDRNLYKYFPIKEQVYKNAVSFAHKNGFEIFAANRMQMSNFVTPFSMRCYGINFVENNPQFYKRTRNGKTVKICSYAYPQVQDFAIKAFVDILPYGFDGITLIMHRGTFIGFEEPVVKRFKQLYGDLDPCLLPISDPRLHNVFCEFMNEFMTKLRRAIDENSQRKIKINVITDYSLATAKHIGLDIEYWAKNGLVDCVSQADMEIYEDLSNCMDDENPELIDMQKYNEELSKRQILKRNYGTNVDKVCAHIPEYRALKEKYGVEVYHVIPWVHSVRPEEYEGIVKRMRKCGAEKFLSFNTNHLVWDLPEWYEVSHIGNEKNENIIQRTFHRVLSLDGNDISQFNSNWRG